MPGCSRCEVTRLAHTHQQSVSDLAAGQLLMFTAALGEPHCWDAVLPPGPPGPPALKLCRMHKYIRRAQEVVCS